MNHFTSHSFWYHLRLLTPELRRIAIKNYRLLRLDPRHRSLQFKRTGPYWSVRVGIGHRALGLPVEDGILWFWIGDHESYDRILKA